MIKRLKDLTEEEKTAICRNAIHKEGFCLFQCPAHIKEDGKNKCLFTRTTAEKYKNCEAYQEQVINMNDYLSF